MKFKRIFAFEFRYQVRRIITWLYFGVVLVLAYLWIMGNYIYDAREGYFLVNAPVVIAAVAVLCSVMWLLIGASVAGDAAARDLHTRMYSLTYTAPSGKAAYLGGRFLAAFVLNCMILLAIPAGLLIALQFSGIENEILGSFRPAAYLTSFFFIVLPNAFFATAIQFSVATLSRSVMGSYLGGAILFVAAYIVGQVLQNSGNWGNLLDPMNFTQVMSYLTVWSPIERNNRLLLSEGLLLANRLLWLGISLGMLALTYYRFRFKLPNTNQKLKSDKDPIPGVAIREKLSRGTWEPLPEIKGTFGFATLLRQLRFITWKAFLQLAKSWAGVPLLAVLALLAGAALQGNLKARGVPLIPRTDQVLKLLTAPLTEPTFFWIIIALLTIYYAGELVWRERENGLSELANATPVPEWILFLSRFLALSLVLVVWLTFLMIAGIIAQAGIGGSFPELGLYVQVLFGLQLVDCLLLALLALLVHVLVNQKYIGHLVALLATGCIGYAANLGVEHNLLIFGSSPRWSYTDMAGFGSSLKPWIWYKCYWIVWSLLLAVVIRLFWVNGREGSFASRLSLARQRFNRSTALMSLSAAAGILLSGGFIFYNTNVLHDYKSASDIMEQRADYEHHYRRYLNSPQPLLKSVNLKVEIYPKQHAVEIRGSYSLVNNTLTSIDTVHLTTGTGVETSAIQFDRSFKELLVDSVHGHRMNVLMKPLLPGDSLRLSFQVRYEARGFSNKGADAQVLNNGTSFRNIEWLPAIGYQPYRELDEAGARKAFGLPPRPTTPSLYDVEARRYAPFPEQISFEAIVGTDADQQVVAPGTLRRSWTNDGRRYFHYATEAPIRNEYSFFSANYAVQEGKWKSPSANSDQKVSIQIFYPKGLTENPERMVRSAQASLEYYTKEFGPYPHNQLRFVAHPGYGFGNHAAPMNITAAEGFFLMNPKEDPRGFDLVTAVVAHEVAHQWWGNMLKAASVEGAGLITESLAWYSAMGVMEDQYGSEHLRRLLNFLREENETPRTRAALPLLQANDWYQNYRKGPLAIYALSKYIGRDRVNEALRNLLTKHRPGTVPMPTSLDLYRELKVVTPDSVQTLLHDLFEANTFWELETETTTSKQIKTDTWQVTFTLKANKLVVDSAGTETKIPMNDWVEIGVYAPAGEGEAGKQLYLQKHLIKSGRQTIQVMVNEKPGKVGFDPNHLLIDWKLMDNYKVVESKN